MFMMNLFVLGVLIAMFGMSLAGPCMLLSIKMVLLNWNVRHFLLNFLGLFVLGLVRSKLKASSLRG